MDRFIQLFGSSLQWSYSCFDRMVINGYLPYLMREPNLVYFFRYHCGVDTITDEILRGRTKDYCQFVEGYALNHAIPMDWLPKEERNQDYLRPYLNRFLRSNQTGVYYILKSMEEGSTFRIRKIKNPSEKQKLHPCVQKYRSRYMHYYFYLVDSQLGPMALRVATFLPFTVTAYINGHNFIERELLRRGMNFCKKDNCFTSVENPEMLQQVADSLSWDRIKARLDYWTWLLTPKFSKRQRQICWGLNRSYAVSEVEYCRNFLFRSGFPIRVLFERSCDLSLYRLQPDVVANLFDGRIFARWRGKTKTALDHYREMPILRAHFKNSFLKLYRKLLNLLRFEFVSNNLTELRLHKSLNQLPEIKAKAEKILDHFTNFQAEALNVSPEFDLFARLAKPVQLAKHTIAGIRMENQRISRIMEVLLHYASDLGKWTTRTLLQTLQAKFGLKPAEYTINQLRYDLRKMRAHGLIDRHIGRYTYALTDKGRKTALMFVVFRSKVYGPIAGSLFAYTPSDLAAPVSKIEKAYRRINRDLGTLYQLLAA